MPAAPASKKRRTIRVLVAGLVVAVVTSAALRAGPFPNLLDDNRGNVGLTVLINAAFNTALTVFSPIFHLPLSPAFSYPPAVLTGRVLANPKIHNLYLDSDWNANNPDAPSKEQLDFLTQELVNSGFFSEAAQYGIGSATFTGSHERSLLCGVFEPINNTTEFVDLLAWVTCMAGFSPLPVPGLFDPFTGVPEADDDSLYVVYLPRNVEMLEGGCGSFDAYHFFGVVPEVDPFPRSQSFAFAVVQTKCISGTGDALRNNIFAAATHEIIEAAHDPIVGLGWINNSVVTEAEADGFFEQIIASLSAIELDLRVGEASDICEPDGDLLDAPFHQDPTPPIPIPTSDGSLGGFYLVLAYWSNNPAGCAPFVPKTTLETGTPSFGQFITSATTLTISAVDGGSGTGVASISWRVYPDDTAPPAFTTQAPPVMFNVTGPDGGYTIEMSATGNNGMVEVVHSEHVILDNTAPIITIVQPTATEYTHSQVLTLDYSATDGAGSGVASLTALLDGSATLAGHGLADGQAINLLFELPLGDHTFVVNSEDRVDNGSQQSVTFSIIVTAQSIMDAIGIMLDAGLIKDPGTATALLAKLQAAADARARGNCAQAASLYRAFINLVEAQDASHIDATAAAILIADAEYLIAHCP